MKTPAKASKKAVKPARKKSASNSVAKKSAKKRRPALLSGGNPQIAKGIGDAPVQAYISAISDWRQDVVHQLDALIVQAFPKVQKAVKWNSPLYGIDEKHFIMSVHIFTKYVKVAFMNGTSLKPAPPGESKQAETRYLNIHEADAIDETQFKRWVKQASKLPGVKM